MLTNLPEVLVSNIYSFTTHSDVIHSSYISKKLNFTPLKDLKKIYESLLEKGVEEIIEVCKGNPKATQAVFMSTQLLRKFNLDQIADIACSHQGNAEVVLKSQLFQDKPKIISEKMQTITTKSEEENNSFDKIMDSILKLNLDDDFKESSKNNVFYDLMKNNKNLKRLDLIEGELNKISRKFCCRNYIARLMAEKDIYYTKFVISQANQTMQNTRHLINLAKISVNHAKVVLKLTSLGDRIDRKISTDIASSSKDHKEFMNRYFQYSLNLIYQIPINISRKQPEKTRVIIKLFIDNQFYSSNNLAWKNFEAKGSNEARNILKAFTMLRRVINKDKIDSFFIKQLISVSPECAKEAFSIFTTSGIKKYLDEDQLESLASKNVGYRLLLDEFRQKESEERRTSSQLKP